MYRFVLFFFMPVSAFSFTLPLEFIFSEFVKQRIFTSGSFRITQEKNGEMHFENFRPTAKSPSPSALSDLLSLTGKKSDELKALLLDAGIDLKKISQGFHENEPVFIVGATPLEKEVPQIWFNKDTFLPVKLLTKDVDLNFNQWIESPHHKGVKFPRLIKRSIKGREEILSISASQAKSGG